MVFERRYSARHGRRQASMSVRALEAKTDQATLQSELERVWGVPVGPTSPLDPPAGAAFGWSRRYRPATGLAGEAHLLRIAGARFLITLQSAARDRLRFRREAAGVLATFRRLNPPPPSVRSTPLPPAPRPPTAPRRRLAGRWVRPGGATLALGADGRYSLADVGGAYVVRGTELRLTRPDGTVQVFRATRSGDRLELAAPGLEAPLVYRRFRPEVALSGRWVARLPKGTLVLALRADGSFVFGPHRGTWSIRGDRLHLEKSKTERIAYRWRYCGGDAGRRKRSDEPRSPSPDPTEKCEFSEPVLTLSGGDLDKPLNLTR